MAGSKLAQGGEDKLRDFFQGLHTTLQLLHDVMEVAAGTSAETAERHPQHFTTHLLHLKKEQRRKAASEADCGSRTDGNNQQSVISAFSFPDVRVRQV